MEDKVDIDLGSGDPEDDEENDLNADWIQTPEQRAEEVTQWDEIIAGLS